MDPSRKRRIRLVVALTAAVVLAGALAYTSFSASSPAVQPSKLLASAEHRALLPAHGQGRGRVDRQARRRHPVPRARPQRRAHRSPCATSGAVPDPFRNGREVIVTVRKQRRRLRGREGLAGDEVPVEVHRQAGVADLIVMAPVGQACLILALATCGYGIGASLYGARTGRRDWVDSGRRSVYGAGGADHRGLRGPRDRLPALGLPLRRRRHALVDHDADLLPRRRGVVLAGGLAAAVGVAAVAVVEPRALPRAPAPARRGALRDGGAARLRRLLHRPARLRGLAVRHRWRRPRRRAPGSTRCCATRA